VWLACVSLISAMAVTGAFVGPLIVLVPFAVFGLIHEPVGRVGDRAGQGVPARR
jgi:hypothetical protein